MTYVNYIQIFSALFFYYCFGRVFVKRAAVSSLLAGIIVSGSVIAVTARYIPLYTRYILYFFMCYGAGYFVYDAIKRRIQFHAHISYKILFLEVVCIIYVSISLFHLSWNEHIYETHDVLYFGPSFEMLHADYFGNLAVPVYYPEKMAANHLMPSACIAAAAVFIEYPDLMDCIEIRYILAIIFVAAFLVRMFSACNIELRKYMLIIPVLMIIFKDELHVELLISSFMYVFVIMEIMVRLLKYTDHKKMNNDEKNECLFFMIFLIICKAPIFYAAAACAACFFVFAQLRRIRISVYIAGILCVLNMLSWVSVEKTESLKKETVFSIADYTTQQGIKSFQGQLSWFKNQQLKDHIQKFLNTTELSDVSFLLIISSIIFIKYYALIFFFFRYNRCFTYRTSLYVYMICSLFGWIFLRNGGTVTHQIHNCLLFSFVTVSLIMVYLVHARFMRVLYFVLLVYYFSYRPVSTVDMFYCTAALLFYIIAERYSYNTEKMVNMNISKMLLCVVCIASILYVYDQHNTASLFIEAHIEKYSSTLDEPCYEFIEKRAEASLQSADQKFYIPRLDEQYWSMELNALLSGLRLRASDVPKLNSGQIRYWILGHNIVDYTEADEKQQNR